MITEVNSTDTKPFYLHNGDDGKMVGPKKKKVLKEKIRIPGRKTYEEVFDKSTLLVLYKLMSDGVLETLDFPISTGKEAKVFKGTQKDGTHVAVKIMRMNTSVFRQYRKYVEGDFRFKDVSSKGRRLIFTWAKKEYANLKRMHENGIKVPEPLAVSKNVLVMEYLEHRGQPAPMLKDVDLDDEDMELVLEDILGYMETLYQDIDMVHGDLSEFNVLLSGVYPYLIDVSQSVPLSHPHAREMLERDIRNVSRYFNEVCETLSITEDEIWDRLEDQEQ